MLPGLARDDDEYFVDDNDDDDDSGTYQLIDRGGCRGLLCLAGDQGVLHVRRHVQLEREGEVSVHLDDWLGVDCNDEDDWRWRCRSPSLSSW